MKTNTYILKTVPYSVVMKQESLRQAVDIVKEHIDSPDADLYSPDAGLFYVEEVANGIEFAYELVDRISNGDTELVASCRWELNVMNDLFRRTLSLLKKKELKEKWKQTIERHLKKIKKELSSFPASSETSPPDIKTIQVDEKKYHLICSSCGEVACAFHTGFWRLMKERGERVIYRGFTRETTLSPEYEQRIYQMLEEELIANLHTCLSTARMVKDVSNDGEPTERRGFLMEDGLDTYCPDCDRIYCDAHWKTRELWDGGFYDYTKGTCPDGHTRVLDD